MDATFNRKIMDATVKPLPLLNHPSVDTSASLKPADLQAAADIYQQILNVNVLGPTLVTRAATNLIDHTMVS